MRIFRKKKSKEEEEELDDEEEEDEKPKTRRRRKTDDDEDESPRKKRPPKPWNKKQRILVLLLFAGMALTSAFLAASSRSWKLPGVGSLELPNLSFQQEYELRNTKNEPKQVDNSEIEEKINSLTINYSGIYAAYMVDLKTGNSYGVNQKKTMQAASLIKLPVMAAFYHQVEQGNENLDDVYFLKEEDKIGGSGSLVYQDVGTKYTYEELLQAMGHQSDNTAFNVVRNKLGDSLIQKYIDQIGMDDTSLEDNLTSPDDIGLFFYKLYNGDLIDSDNADQLLEFLTDTIYEDWIATQVEGSRVAHKYGREVHVINDAGIVFTKRPFVMVVMTQGVVDSEAEEILPQVIRELYDYQLTQE